MDISQYQRNALGEIERIGKRIDERAEMNRTNTNPIIKAIWSGKIDLLFTLGLFPEKVRELREKLDRVPD